MVAATSSPPRRRGRARNLAADPWCALGSSSTAPPAVEVVVEGEAVKVTDDAKVRRVADAFAATMHWPLEVRDGAVVGPNAPTAGPPPYAVFELTRRTVVACPVSSGWARGSRPRSGRLVGAFKGVSQSQLPYCATYGPRLAARPGEGLKSPRHCSPRPVRSRECSRCGSP
jgi:hypothetical protein